MPKPKNIIFIPLSASFGLIKASGNILFLDPLPLTLRSSSGQEKTEIAIKMAPTDAIKSPSKEKMYVVCGQKYIIKPLNTNERTADKIIDLILKILNILLE